MILNAEMTHRKTDENAQHATAIINSPKSEEINFNDVLRQVGENQDKTAFITLFEHFAPRVKSFLMKGGATPEAADEIAQETMLVIWRKAESYDPQKAAASTWIFTIARNKRIDALRKTKRHDMNPSDPLILEDTAPSPRENIQYGQEAHIIAKALKKLPEEQSELIQKSFFEDKSHAQIAEESGIPLGTVKSRIRLALQRLRKDPKVKGVWS